MRIHFIAVGGSAMHNLAIALKINGHEVSGSDDEIFEPSRSRLRSHGLLPEKEGWYPERLNENIDAVILGMHAKPDNPELKQAQAMGLTIYSYPEFLYDHARDKLRVVIGGSHGKTTITGMVMHILRESKMNFDYLVGSRLKDFDVMVRLSEKAPVMVFEGDEYLSSPIDRRPKFHLYKPDIALISGIAWDHINVFPTFPDYLSQFEKFIDLISPGGKLVYCMQDNKLAELVDNGKSAIEKIGYKMPEYTIDEGITYLIIGGKRVPLRIFGGHNLLNIEGARHICEALGISASVFYRHISSFDGTSNRLELVLEKEGSRLYKDFAHAPSKVKATLAAVREQFPEHRLVSCLELHTYSSLNKEFLDHYRGSLDGADEASVFYNPHALKMKRLPDLDPHFINKSFGYEKLAIFADSKGLEDWLVTRREKKSIYLMMSSGNFGGVKMSELAEKLM
ncbi:MAG: Mur ligase family protein [bacterium]